MAALSYFAGSAALDSFEFNKIAGWTLAAFLVLLAVSIGTSMAFRPVKPDKPSYVVEGVEADTSADCRAQTAWQKLVADERPACCGLKQTSDTTTPESVER